MYRKTLYNIIIYGLLSVLPKLINFIFLKLFTIKLNPSEYSIYTDMYSITLIIIGLLTMGLESSYLRFIYKKEYSLKKVFTTVMVTLIFINIIIIFLYLIFFNDIANISGYKNHKEYFIMFFIIIFCDVISSIPMTFLRIYNIHKYFYIRISSIIINYLIIIYLFNINIINNYIIIYYLTYPLHFIKIYTNEVGYIFYSNTISSLIVFFSLFPIIIKKIYFKTFDYKLSIKILNYGIPIMLGVVSFAINENLDKIIIKRLISDELNGAYSACYKIASIMNLYVSAFRMGIEPIFFKNLKNNSYKSIYSDIIYIFIIIGIIIYVIISSNLKLISYFMIDKKYYSTLEIIPIILMANLFLGIYNTISITHRIKDKPIIITYISIVGVLITIFFNLLLLIKGIKYIVCAWGTLFSYLIMAVLSYLWSINNFKINYPVKKIFIHITIAFIISHILYDIKNVVYNYILQLLYFTIIFFIERKIFIKFFKF